jgi:exopolysaccharide biosynthesis polyprenyl glycosylphosphotransferase
MVSKSSLNGLQQDLRSPQSIRLRRGLIIVCLRIALLLLLDSGAIALAWLLAIELGTPIDSLWTIADGTHLLPIVLVVEIGMIAATRLYKGGDYRRHYWDLTKAISLANLLLLLMAFLIDPNRYVSRSIFVIFWLLSISLTSLGRMLFDLATWCIREHGAIRHPVYLICSLEAMERNTELIGKQQFYNLLGIADSSALDRDQRASTFLALQKMGISEVFVSWDAIKNRLHLCWYFQSAGITLRILPNDVIAFPSSQFWTVNGIPALTVAAPMLVGSDFQIKRFFDFCAALVLVTLLAPLYLLIAVLIKLDSPGPIFFRQTRIGLHGRQFKVWKFRTMVTNAEQLQRALEAKNEMKDGVLFKMKDDPRITRIGGFLRQYSLDELPQIFNVLLGEMSLVGPRPLPVRDVERFQERHFIRQEVLPGITGLWQVSGRSDITDFDAAVDLDLNYIASWSLWLDLKILLQTVMVVLFRKGAY